MGTTNKVCEVLMKHGWVWPIILGIVVLSGCSWDPRPQVERPPVPVYPNQTNYAVDPMKMTEMGFPYESTTFETRDSPEQVIIWFKNQLVGTSWLLLEPNSTSSFLWYHDSHGCPAYELTIRATATSGSTHVEVGVKTKECR